MLRSSWILNECKFPCKIVKNCRIIGLNRAKKNKSVRGLYDKKGPQSTVYLRRDERKYVQKAGYTPPDSSPRFTSKLNLSNTKNPA